MKNKRFNPQIGSEGSEAEVEHGGGERGAEMVNAYWRIGREIVEVEQLGEVRAVYADELIERLAVRLSKEFGKRDGLEVPVADAKVLPDVRQRFASAALNSANSVVGIPTN